MIKFVFISEEENTQITNTQAVLMKENSIRNKAISIEFSLSGSILLSSLKR